MSVYDERTQCWRGPRGTAVKLRIDPTIPGADTTTCWWLLTGNWHPIWTQFVLTVVTLADRPGAPPARLQHPGMTHELIVVALDPGEPPRRHSATLIETGGLRGVGGWLEPVDVVQQFTATDEEMRQVAELAAQACIDGILMPSTDDARTFYREQWLQAIVKTLAHLRGEEHTP